MFSDVTRPAAAAASSTSDVDQAPGGRRRRRPRFVFSSADLARLESVFLLDQYPDIVLREELADQIGVSEARIHVSINYGVRVP